MGRKSPYSRSDINKIIDSLCHPLFKQYPWMRFIDGLLHALNESNPEESLQKFLKYHAKDLIEELMEWLSRK